MPAVNYPTTLNANIMSDEQLLSLFEILGFPYVPGQGGVSLTDNIGLVRSIAAITPAASITPQVIAYITGTIDPALAVGNFAYPNQQCYGITYQGIASTGQLKHLLKRVNRWIELDTMPTEMNGGGVDGVTQVTYRVADERKNIREFVRDQIPFWKQWYFENQMFGSNDGPSSQSTGGGGTQVNSIPIVR